MTTSRRDDSQFRILSTHCDESPKNPVRFTIRYPRGRARLESAREVDRAVGTRLAETLERLEQRLDRTDD